VEVRKAVIITKQRQWLREKHIELAIYFSRNHCLCFAIITALRTSTRFYLFTWTEDAVWRNRFALNNINAC